MLPNLPIFAQNGRHFVSYHGNGGGGVLEQKLNYLRKSRNYSIYFLIFSTNSHTIATFHRWYMNDSAIETRVYLL